MTVRQGRWAALAVFVLVAGLVATAQERPRREGRSKVEEDQPPRGQAERGQRPERVQREAARPGRREPPEVFVFPLEHAEAVYVAEVLKPVRAVLDGISAISPDERTNTLVVAAAGEPAARRVREILETLDRPAQGAVAGEACYEVVQLEHAVAAEVLESLHRLAPRTPALRFVADERANAVWLAGAEPLVDQAAALVRRMDDSTAAAEVSGRDEGRKLGFYHLKHGNPWELANALQVIGQYKDSEVGVVVASGQLVVFATPDMHALVTDVVARLDVPQPEHAQKKPPAERRQKRERPREPGPREREPEP